MMDTTNLELLPADLREKANQIMIKEGIVAMASVDAEGYPRICILSCMKPKDIGTIMVSTGAVGTKVSHFKSNPKASVCVSDKRNSVTMMGEIEFVTDRQIKEDIFVDWMYDHFSGVDDPNYCVIAFHPQTATIWIEGQFGTYRL